MTQNSFGALGVPARLVDSLTAGGILNPFPIQTSTLPDSLAGRDVLGRGKTGSGKTLAFSLPLAARLGADGRRARPGHPRGLILAPTRELATQIAAVVSPLAASYGLTTTTIFGGVTQSRQVAALKAGADIVVACPGRLEDLMKQGFVKLDAVEVTVLDEADHMADLGFLPGVTRIMTATPTTGQRLLFSATLDNGVDKLVKRFLVNPVRHSVDEASSPVAAMTHHVFEVADVESKRVLVEKLASGTGRRILFMRTKHQAKKLAKQLTAAGIPSVDLHGNLSQPARDRNLKAFSDGTARVLVATDVAARGVHVDGIELVVHVDPPAEHKAYLHRSGRTARAGSEGDVVTLVLPEQRRDTRDLLRKAAISAQPRPVRVDSPEVTSLVGEIAAWVKPVAPAPVQQQRRQGGGQRAAASGGAGRRRGGRGGAGRSDDARGDGARSGAAPRGGSNGARSGGAKRSSNSSAPVYSTSTGGASSGSAARFSERGSTRRPARAR